MHRGVSAIGRAAKPTRATNQSQWVPSARDHRRRSTLGVCGRAGVGFCERSALLRDPAGPAGRKLGAADVIDVLSDLFILRGVPGHIRSDNVLCREAAEHVRPQVSIASLG